VSQSDSFIHEVTEEVRRERLYRWLRRYGWIGILAAVMIVAAAGLNEWRKARATAAAQEAGDALRAALAVQDPAERAAALEALSIDAGALAALARAGSLAEAGDRAAAGEVLAAVAADADLAPVYRDLARLQRVMVLGAELEMSERLATLEGLAAPGAPFRPLALEQRALARLEAGEVAAAHEDLEAIIAEAVAPTSLVARAQELIVASGGTLPGGGEAAPAPAAPAPVDG
jgi:hypothetical protein